MPNVNQSKEEFLKQIENDDEMAVDDVFQFSLLDPLSKLRMTCPVRSVKCDHLPCFDLHEFIALYGNKEEMHCPICNQQIYLDDLKEDFYVLSILEKTDEEQDEVNIKPNGEWEVIQRSEHESEEEEMGSIESIEREAAETVCIDIILIP